MLNDAFNGPFPKLKFQVIFFEFVKILIEIHTYKLQEKSKKMSSSKMQVGLKVK